MRTLKLTGASAQSDHCLRCTRTKYLDSIEYSMNLIGATYIRASKLSSHASWVGWPGLTEFDFRPRLASNPLYELRYNAQVNNI